MSVSALSIPPVPWYRQAWPWFLIALPATAVFAGSFTAWLAVKSNDGLVADDYYKEGLAINKVVDRSEHAVALGLSADVKITAGHVWLKLAEKGQAAMPSAVQLTISHPTRAGRDQKVLLQGSGGTYAGGLGDLSIGRWDLALEDDKGNWRLNGSIHVPEETEITMHPYALTPAE